MRFLLTLGVLLALLSPAHAQSCYTVEQFKADVAKAGDTIVGTVEWNADNSDMMMFVQAVNGVSGWAFKGGCLVASIPIDALSPSKETKARLSGRTPFGIFA